MLYDKPMGVFEIFLTLLYPMEVMVMLLAVVVVVVAALVHIKRLCYLLQLIIYKKPQE